MANFEFDVDDFLRGLDMADKRVQKGADRGMHDSTDELERISSEIAPFKSGQLSGKESHSKKVNWHGDKVVGTVTFSVAEDYSNGHYNYALRIHELNMNQKGEGTIGRPGTNGWSGKHYMAGPKYLERPLKGESDAFKKHIAEEIRKELT